MHVVGVAPLELDLITVAYRHFARQNVNRDAVVGGGNANSDVMRNRATIGRRAVDVVLG
jgi:hypothetical protein